MDKVLAGQPVDQNLLLQHPPHLSEVELDVCNQIHTPTVEAHVGGRLNPYTCAGPDSVTMFKAFSYTNSNVYLGYIYIYAMINSCAE
ncbi:hypothetical protein ACOSQ2_007055 [Xanthoceras sorbifolium]